MNQLEVNRQQSIVSLFEQGWSKRRIARELTLDRATVRKYLEGVGSKSPTPQTGSSEKTEAKSPHCHPVKSRWSRWNVFFYNALREENGVSDLKMAVRFFVDFLEILLAKMLACIPEKPFSLNLWIGSIPSSFAAAWLVIAATIKSVTSLAGINSWL